VDFGCVTILDAILGAIAPAPCSASPVVLETKTSLSSDGLADVVQLIAFSPYPHLCK